MSHDFTTVALAVALENHSLINRAAAAGASTELSLHQENGHFFFVFTNKLQIVIIRSSQSKLVKEGLTIENNTLVITQ